MPDVAADGLLSVRDLRVAYGPIEAVSSLSLEVYAGQLVALLGPNGAGKSSTLKAISGLVPYHGTVFFDGDKLGRRSVVAIARQGLLHVPEGRRILPTLTVHENLEVATAARASRPATFTVEDVYDLFPMLVPLQRRGGWALSGGEQQMLAIGRALVGAPRCLLLDEPALGLAPRIVKDVFGALATIKDRVPVLLVEQNTAVALRVCTYAYVMTSGRIALAGTPEELRRSQELVDTYLGQRGVEHR